MKKLNKEWFDDKLHDLKFEARITWEGIKKTARQAPVYFYENREFILFAAPIAIGGIRCLTNVHKKRMALKTVKAEQHWKDTHNYDPSTGVYVHLRRPMTEAEKVKLARRPKGETVTEWLDDMGLIKKW